MKVGTREDYELLDRLEIPFLRLTADRVLDELRRAGDAALEGYKITRLKHGLQSGTRALRDGVDIDWVVGALLHDVGDGLAPQNHDRMSAEVIRPFVRWEVCWTVEHHGIFRHSISGIITAGTETPGTGTAITRSLTPARPSVNGGTNQASIPVIRPRRWKRSSQWCARCFPAKPTIRISSAKAR